MTPAILVLFTGYSVASYGVVLLRGYDITFRQWINPLDPYKWPAGQIPTIPSGQVFPGSEAANAAPAGEAAGTARKSFGQRVADAARQELGRLIPGSGSGL